MTKPEQDAGINYALVKEAKETAEKYNNSLRMVRAFTKRRAALNKAKKAGQDTANLSEKIEELEDSIDNAETEKAKAMARLNKLREGGVSVDEHLLADKPGETQEESWDVEVEEEEPEVKEVNYFSYDQVNYGESEQPGAAWGEEEPAGWQPSPPPEASSDLQPVVRGQALVLYNFDATSSDELTVSEGEWVNLLASQTEEDGWVTAENREGQTGLVPASFLTETTPEEYEASLAAQQIPEPEPSQDWTAPALPSCPPPALEQEEDEEEDNSSEDEETTEDSDDDDGPPPGLAPPPGPPPAMAPPPSPCAPPQSVAGKYKSVKFIILFHTEYSFSSQTIICLWKRLSFSNLTI